MNIKLLDTKEMHELTSGPGMGFFDERLYMPAGDASSILVMNKGWKALESVTLHLADTVASLPGLRAAVMIRAGKVPFLLLPGSGASGGQGSSGMLVNLETSAIEALDLAVFHQRLQEAGLREPNIVAATVMDDKMILYSKGIEAGTGNCLIVTAADFWLNQPLADITLIKIEFEPKADLPFTATGIAYSYKNDWLIITASAESTGQNTDDAVADDSYLGIIENVSRKIGRKKLKLKDMTRLTDVHKKFRGCSVYALCIQADKEKKLKIHLAAENKDHEVVLYKIQLKE